MSSLIKTVIIVAVIAGLGFVGYNYLSKSPGGDGLVVVKNDGTSQIGAQVLTALNQLQLLKLDEKVFSDATFKSLKDFSRPIASEPVGRINPFSPIGIEKSATNVTMTATTTAPKTRAIPAKTTTPKAAVKPELAPVAEPDLNAPMDANF